MDSSDQSQRPPEDNLTPYPIPPDDEQTIPMASGAYPPPYNPAPSFPPTVAMAQLASPAQPAPGRLGRIQALDLLSRLKATLVTGSVLAFGVFAALAAAHVTGVTSHSSAATQSGGSQSSQATPSRHDDDGGFFNTGPSGGFGVGAPGSQGPASSTSVS
jgi:hypothetical protein